MLQGDCMDFLRDKPDKFWDLAIVDPPYGIDRDEGFEGFEGFGGFGKPIARKKYKGEWDNETPPQKYFTELLRVCDHVIIWGGNSLRTNYQLGDIGYFGTNSIQCQPLGMVS